MAYRSFVFSLSIATFLTLAPTPRATAACDALRLKSGEVRMTLHFEAGKVFDGGRTILALVTDSSRSKLGGQYVMFTLPEGRQATAHPGYRWSVYRDVIARADGERVGYPHFVLGNNRTLPRRAHEIPVAGSKQGDGHEIGRPDLPGGTPYFIPEADRIRGPDAETGRPRHGEGRFFTDRLTDRRSGPDAESPDFSGSGQNEGYTFERGTGGPF